MVNNSGALGRRPDQVTFNHTNVHEPANESAQVDSETFDQLMNRYYAECKYKIKKNWNPASRIGTLRIDTRFRIHRNGDITNIVITRTSGSSADNSLAISAIKRAIPLAPLPPGNPAWVEVDFVFEINFGSNSEPFQQSQNRLCPPRRTPIPPNNPANGLIGSR
jgi:TonB family protein